MKRHQVNTKHPRYRVPNYPRGRGEGNGHPPASPLYGGLDHSEGEEFGSGRTTNMPLRFEPRWTNGMSRDDTEEAYRNLYRRVHGTNEGMNIVKDEPKHRLSFKIRRLWNEANFKHRLDLMPSDYFYLP